MVDWNNFEERLTSQGKTLRDTRLNRAKHQLNKYGKDNPSYKTVVMNGNKMTLAINSGTKPYYKTFHTLPDEVLYPGDLVYWKNSAWLVLNADFDDELYVDGNLQQCNYKLRWQNSDLDIIERDIVAISATAYNSGVEDKALITLGYDQLMIYIPFDNETIALERDKRFFIGNTKKPTPYKLTSINSTSNVYQGHGYLQLIVSEDVKYEDDDNIELGICNYKESNGINTPSEDNLYSKIAYKSLKIKSGYNKGTSFAAEFYNQDIKQTDIFPIWIVNCTFRDKLTIEENGDKITILIDDDSYIGQRINLTLSDKKGNFKKDTVILEVTGLF